MQTALTIPTETRRLSAKQARFVETFLAAREDTIEQSATASGYSGAQASALMRLPQIQSALRESYKGELHELGAMAFNTLRDVMSNGGDSAQARVALAIVERVVPAEPAGDSSKDLGDMTNEELLRVIEANKPDNSTPAGLEILPKGV